jgi:hypothetical protein
MKGIVYIAGPYRGKTIFHVLLNIFRAWREAYRWWKMGYTVICPNTNSLLMSEFGLGEGIDFICADLEILCKCDMIVMLPNWEDSEGAREEHHCAVDLGLEVIYA